jgi:protein-disulfide isomerase
MVQTITGRTAAPSSESGPPWRLVWIVIGLAVALVAGGITTWALVSSRASSGRAAPPGVVDDAGLVAAGTGPVTVEVYVDFLCPLCRTFVGNMNPSFSRLLAANRIRLVWHPVSYFDEQSKPPGYATRAAASVACAADAGKLAAYGNALLYLQPPQGAAGLSDDQLIDIAGDAGIITPLFARCVRSRTYAGWIADAGRQAADRGVTALPAVFVNGRPIADPSVANIEAATQ